MLFLTVDQSMSGAERRQANLSKNDICEAQLEVCLASSDFGSEINEKSALNDVAIAFESPRFLLRQTGKKLDEFAETMRKITHGQNVRMDRDPLTRDKLYKLVVGRNNADDLRHIAASAINDLRHALDQTACAAVKAATGIEPSHTLYFPIGNGLTHFQNKVRQDFPIDLHAVFLSFDVYPSDGVNKGNDLICHLSKAAQNKHRISAQFGARLSQMSGGLSLRGAKSLLASSWNEELGELTFQRLAPDGSIQGTAEYGFHMLLSEAGPLTGSPLPDVLEKLRSAVGDIVIRVQRETTKIVVTRS